MAMEDLDKSPLPGRARPPVANTQHSTPEAPAATVEACLRAIGDFVAQSVLPLKAAALKDSGTGVAGAGGPTRSQDQILADAKSLGCLFEQLESLAAGSLVPLPKTVVVNPGFFGVSLRPLTPPGGAERVSKQALAKCAALHQPPPYHKEIKITLKVRQETSTAALNAVSLKGCDASTASLVARTACAPVQVEFQEEKIIVVKGTQWAGVTASPTTHFIHGYNLSLFFQTDSPVDEVVTMLASLYTDPNRQKGVKPFTEPVMVPQQSVVGLVRAIVDLTKLLK